ncbi:MAG TPA: glycolate oxidase subunit GlcF [Dongiaceae bacterium]|nr:glycolate oxidase subunit GlcF [Dongiaceae bacterium]
MSGEEARLPKTSAFDEHHPPAKEIIDKCVHCGFCLPVCPTYVLWGEEMDSPRGRIYLMKMAAEGAASMTEKWVGHFDACLGCVACMTACPSGVDYGKLIEATRAQIERNFTRPLPERLHRRLIFSIFTQPRRLNLLRWYLRLYQRSGLQKWVRKSGILPLVSKQLATAEALLPKIRTVEAVAEITLPRSEKRKRVGLLLGCVQRAFLSHVNAATARVLAAEGYEVIAPAAQSCCGALLMHGGEEEGAKARARQTIEVFERADVDYVVANAAGCGSAVKEYAHLLRDDPQYAGRAQRFSSRCRDVCELLGESPLRSERKPLTLRVAFHDSCHLQHAQGVRVQPRLLLSQVPGVEILEIPEAAICCGSAGIYNLVQPEAANALGDRKAGLIAPLKPSVVVTGNPGCMLQLEAALARAKCQVPVLHTIQVLDASIRGVPVESL